MNNLQSALQLMRLVLDVGSLCESGRAEFCVLGKIATRLSLVEESVTENTFRAREGGYSVILGVGSLENI